MKERIRRREIERINHELLEQRHREQDAQDIRDEEEARQRRLNDLRQQNVDMEAEMKREEEEDTIRFREQARRNREFLDANQDELDYSFDFDGWSQKEQAMLDSLRFTPEPAIEMQTYLPWMDEAEAKSQWVQELGPRLRQPYQVPDEVPCITLHKNSNN